MKKGFGIKPSHKGLFLKWCKQNGFKGVTSDCIKKALASKDIHTKRMAIFAKNAKNHFKGK